MANLEKVFITGATGFLGSHLVKRLIRSGAVISALVRENPDRIATEPNKLHVVGGDVTRPFSITEASMVFHLAAVTHVGNAFRDPRKTFETNTAGTVNVLEAVRQSVSVEKLVFVSTAHVYGVPKYTPVDEEHPLRARELYAASKLAAETLVSAYSSAYGIPICIARLFNTYGPRQNPDFVVPSIIKQALTRQTLEMGNLSPTRDFTYVDDVIEALLLLADTGDGIYNVASGVEVSIGALVHIVAEILDKPLTVASDSALKRSSGVEIDRMWADNTRIKLLGWEPHISLNDGLTKTIAWYREHL